MRDVSTFREHLSLFWKISRLKATIRLSNQKLQPEKPDFSETQPKKAVKIAHYVLL
jgi:hypothetical protein